MHSFFNNIQALSHAVIKSPDWPYARAGLIKNLGSVISYYRKNPVAVKSNHFLVRLLHSIAVPQSMPLDRYYDNVDTMAMNLSMALKMTSSIYRGRLFENIFYGPDSREILIATNNWFDYEKANANWENVRAVEIVRHDMSDLSLNIPDGSNNWTESGIAVIMINIPMLAVQYRAFRRMEAYYSNLTGDNERSVMQFIHMYVLPNMLYSHLDHALINRMNNVMLGAPMGEGIRKHSFFIPRYDDRVNRVQEYLVNSFAKSNKDFATIMETIPLINRENVLEFAKIPDMAPTQQVNWALTVGRLPILTLLLMLSAKHGLRRNMLEINLIHRLAKYYRNNSIMEQMLPVDVFIDVNNEINALLAL